MDDPCTTDKLPESAQGKTRILVAEDSPVSRRLLEGVLADQPYLLSFATNGQEALKGFAEYHPDILILDWMMPGLSGPELCRLIRDSETAYTYIILVTSLDRSRLIEGLDAGADDYLTKPFDAGELLARIRVGCRVVKMSREIETRNAQLEETARTDHLTGMPNRRAVEEFGTKQLSAAIRQGFPLWVIVADLDKFKLVNDAHGHSAGDEAIKKFAAILKENTRAADLSGRMGGDEFVLVISYGRRAAILQVIERLRADLANEPFCFNGQRIQITASFGVAGFQGHSNSSFHELLIQADNALYAAKGNGRNQVRVAAPEFSKELVGNNKV
jgi:two-component system chemotaxis response regulator CheY